MNTDFQGRFAVCMLNVLGCLVWGMSDSVTALHRKTVLSLLTDRFTQQHSAAVRGHTHCKGLP